jgi:class 3 adenylate cyclase
VRTVERVLKCRSPEDGRRPPRLRMGVGTGPVITGITEDIMITVLQGRRRVQGLA